MMNDDLLPLLLADEDNFRTLEVEHGYGSRGRYSNVLMYTKNLGYTSGAVHVGTQSERQVMKLWYLANVKPDVHTTVYSMSCLPSILLGPEAGKCFRYKRIVHYDTVYLRYWSPKTYFMWNSATLLYLMAHQPLEDASEMPRWKEDVCNTAYALEVLASKVLPNQGEWDTVTVPHWFAHAQLFFQKGYKVIGDAWSRMPSVQNINPMYPDYYVAPFQLMEEEPDKMELFFN